MDVEDQDHQAPTSKQVLTDTVIAFCQTIEKAGYYAMIYSSTSGFITSSIWQGLLRTTSGLLSGAYRNRLSVTGFGNIRVTER